MNNRIKILIVEDEKMLAEILSDTLSDRNFDVRLAYDGIHALEAIKKEPYVIGEYEFNPSSKELTIRGQQTTLAAREAAVLVRLCRKRGRVVEASELLKELWGDDNYFNLRSLNVYITRLRNHLKADPTIEI